MDGIPGNNYPANMVHQPDRKQDPRMELPPGAHGAVAPPGHPLPSLNNYAANLMQPQIPPPLSQERKDARLEIPDPHSHFAAAAGLVHPGMMTANLVDQLRKGHEQRMEQEQQRMEQQRMEQHQQQQQQRMEQELAGNYPANLVIEPDTRKPSQPGSFATNLAQPPIRKETEMEQSEHGSSGSDNFSGSLVQQQIRKEPPEVISDEHNESFQEAEQSSSKRPRMVTSNNFEKKSEQELLAEKISNAKPTFLVQPDRNHLWKEIGKYRREGKFLDLELKCGDALNQSIFCHKIILISCSRFLRRYLRHVDQESVVFLPDVQFEELRQYVDEIYFKLEYDGDPGDVVTSFGLAEVLGLGLPLSKFSSCKPDPELTDYSKMFKMNIKTEEEFENNDMFEDPIEYIAKQEEDPDLYYDTEFGEFRKKPPKPKKPKKPKKKVPYFDRRDDYFSKDDENETLYRTYPCDECGEILSNIRKYRMHKRMVHIPDRKIFASCRFCKKEVSVRMFPKHLDRFHRSHVCDICGTQFPKWSSLYDHVRYKHTVFTCNVCQQTCKGYDNLKMHKELEHCNAFHCEICGKQFQRMKNLQGHKRSVHTAEADKKYHCEYCGKGFVDRTSYQSHVSSVHTKDRPFICRFKCGATYNCHSNMLKHEKTKHGISFSKLKKPLPI